METSKIDAAEAAKEQTAQKNKERKRRFWFFLFGASFLTLLICVIYLSHRLSKTEVKVEKTETIVKLISADCKTLKDSLRELTTIVKDTMYPVLVSQQSYVKTFEKNFKDVNSNLSFVDSKLKKVNKNLDSFRASQVSFVSTFDKNFQEVKSKYDSLDAKVKKPVVVQTNTITPVLTLPIDTQKSKTLVAEDKKIVHQNNGGHGGQKKIRFDKFFKKSTIKTPGW